MRLRDSYDIPESVKQAEHSPAFNAFLWNWFGDTRAITHGELDITFLKDLTDGELETARSLIRKNLKSMQNHIIEGTAALGDVAAAPMLRLLLDQKPDLSISRRLTIGGALWKAYVCDPVFRWNYFVRP